MNDNPKELHHIAKEGGGAALLSISGSGLKYICTIIITHTIGPALYGAYTLAQTVISFISTIAMLGLSQGSMAFIARFKGEKDPNSIRKLISLSLFIAFITGLILSFAILPLSRSIGEGIFHKHNVTKIIFYLSPIILFSAITGVTLGILQGMMKVRLRMLLDRVIRYSTQMLMLILAYFLLKNILGIIISLIMSTLLVTILSLIFTIKNIPTAKEMGNKPIAGELFTFSIPLMFVGALNFIIKWGDTFLVGYFLKAYQLGIYGICARLADALIMPLETLSMTLSPKMGEAYFAGRREEALKHLHTLTRWVCLIILPIGGLFLTAPKLILTVFGKNFSAGWHALTILAIGRIISGLFGNTGALLIVTGYSKLNLFNAILMAGSNIALNLLLIPRFGIIGAALSSSLSISMVNILKFAEVVIIFHAIPWDRNIIKPIIIFTFAISLSLLGQRELFSTLIFIASFSFPIILFGLCEEDREIFHLVISKIKKPFIKRLTQHGSRDE